MYMLFNTDKLFVAFQFMNIQELITNVFSMYSEAFESSLQAFTLDIPTKENW